MGRRIFESVKPVEVGGLRLKNRLARLAMGASVAASGGGVDEADCMPCNACCSSRRRRRAFRAR